MLEFTPALRKVDQKLHMSPYPHTLSYSLYNRNASIIVTAHSPSPIQQAAGADAVNRSSGTRSRWFLLDHIEIASLRSGGACISPLGHMFNVQ